MFMAKKGCRCASQQRGRGSSYYPLTVVRMEDFYAK